MNRNGLAFIQWACCLGCFVWSLSTRADETCNVTRFLAPDDLESSQSFGTSIAAAEGALAVGAPNAYSDDEGDGRVYLYGVGDDDWNFEGYLVSPYPSSRADFGSTVAFGSGFLVVGATSESNVATTDGAVYVFAASNGSWVLHQKLVSSEPQEYDQFGLSMATANDLIVVGVSSHDEPDLAYVGAAYVYRLINGVWQYESKLLPHDGKAFQYFGSSVVLMDGYLLIGSSRATGLTDDAGAVYCYHFNGESWEFLTKIFADDGKAFDSFGGEMVVYDDHVLIGAPDFTDPSGNETGKAYLYRLGENGWGQEAEFEGSSAPGVGSEFGRALTMNDTLIAISNPNDTESPTGTGAVYVFRLFDDTWTQTEKLIQQNTEVEDTSSIGYSILIIEDEVLVGDYYDAFECYHPGAIHRFVEIDCNRNGFRDACEQLSSGFADCNLNSVPDECDIASSTSHDIQLNGIPDECEGDCNSNGVPDDWDIATQASSDCQANLIPDECEADCNHNQQPDSCDILNGRSLDSDADTVPDECQSGACRGDVNGDGVIDPLDSGAIQSRLGCTPDLTDPECWNADVTKDGRVDPLDAGFVLSRFGVCATARPLYGAMRFEVDHAANHVLQSDLNGDGAPDLVLSTESVATISVLFNDGLGFIGEPVDIPLASSSARTEAGDLDADGDIDLVVVLAGQDAIQVVFNHGDGILAAGPTTGTAHLPVRATLADLDGDTDLDLAVALADDSPLQILANEGTGHFTVALDISLAYRAVSLTAADIDGDMDHDLIVGLEGNDLQVLFNTGDFTFDESDSYYQSGSAIDVYVTDMDSDGDGDVISVFDSSAEALAILTNNGKGQFEPGGSSPLIVSPDASAFADVNRDGAADIIVIDMACDCLGLYLNTGSGAFESATTHPLRDDPLSLAPADFDGDGLTDLCSIHAADSWVHVLLADPVEGLALPAEYTTGEGAFAVEVADLNGDSWLDVAVTNTYDETVTIRIGTTSGYLALRGEYEVGDLPLDLASGDLDGDGDVDLVVAMDAWSDDPDSLGLKLMFNLGYASFEVLPLDVGAGTNAIAVGDLDEDGFDDIAAALSDGRLAVFRSIGEEEFEEPSYYGGWEFSMSVIMNDVDRDGDLDIIMPIDSSECGGTDIGLFHNRGNGDLDEPVVFECPENVDYVVAGDLDEDQDTDLVLFPGYLSDNQPTRLYGLVNDGSGNFEIRNLGLEDYYWRGELSDIDADRDLDLAVVAYTEDYEDYYVKLLLNRGDATFEPYATMDTEQSVSNVAAADLNGDSDVDFVTSHWDVGVSGTEIISVLSNRSVILDSTNDCNNNGVPDESDPDCDGDGVPDGCDFGGVEPSFGEVIISNTTGLPDSMFLGPPDHSYDGIGLGGLIYHFPEFPILDYGGPDFNVYGGPNTDWYDFEEIDVLVSQDGVTFYSIKESEGLVVRIEGDEELGDSDDARSYDMAVSALTSASYLSVQTKDLGARWSGFPLDAIGVILAGTTDCNSNGVPDDCDLADGLDQDCNANGILDGCEQDCNASGVPDDCDIDQATSLDCNSNGVPDECDLDLPTADCNGNGIPDDCDLIDGTSMDCNINGLPDDCDIAQTLSADCDGNAVPDECEGGCNANQQPDSCDLADGTSTDCNANSIPDECEPDCNGNALPDDCDLESGESVDCDENGVPDECEADCNANGVHDACDLADGSSPDCNVNGVPDECEAGALVPDCNINGVPDSCDVESGHSPDCNANTQPDECDILGPYSAASGELSPLGYGSNQSFVLQLPPVSAGDVTLLFTAMADLGHESEYVDVRLEELWVGEVFRNDADDCPDTPNAAALTIAKQTYNDAVANSRGFVTLSFEPSFYASPELCGLPWIAVTVEYQRGADCNGNLTPDDCDIASGSSRDANVNGVPDECD